MDFDDICMLIDSREDSTELEKEMSFRVQLLMALIEELTDGRVVYARSEGQAGH